MSKISIKKGLEIVEKIIKDAEKERKIFVEEEAKKGIQYLDETS